MPSKRKIHLQTCGGKGTSHDLVPEVVIIVALDVGSVLCRAKVYLSVVALHASREVSTAVDTAKC